MLQITATPVPAKELKPGDLFSTAGPLYWGSLKERASIGEKVYIRTDVPADRFCEDDPNAIVYRITLERRD